LRDVESTLAMLRAFGAKAKATGRGGARVCAAGAANAVAPYDLVRKMRASILALGPLLARFGEAQVALPGGCAIGARPVDEHIAGLRKLGARVEVFNGYIKASCKRLRGCEIALAKPSVTATENLMMAAALAEGETVIENAAREPEVANLAAFINGRGGRITGAGGATIRIVGASALAGGKFAVMPDRIEAGTYLAAVAACGGEALLRGANADDMRAVIAVFEQGGVRVAEEADGLRVVCARRFAAQDAETAPYPGYPTDMQAQLLAANCVGKGRAAVAENIFENRFMHVAELARMGANIELRHNTAIVTGVERLAGAPVMATDLRASASLAIAALAAKGASIISRVYHLDRGYARMEKKLRGLGANVRRLSS
jgi:UDP-N-acetylglucosamine 1-carboxyvinyltransferase